MVRRAAKVDTNQPEIVAALKAVGASVQHLHMVGDGCFDILVGFRGVNYLLEIKTSTGKLNDLQKEFRGKWKGHKDVVRSIDQALFAIGAIHSYEIQETT